jgi:REP element-mobilizing transposase RayT
MAQTLVVLLVHIVFSTKNRANLIAPEVETELYSYVGGILKGRVSRLIAAGGTSNHVHLLISLSKNDALPAMMQELRKSTSKWIKAGDTSLAHR